MPEELTSGALRLSRMGLGCTSISHGYRPTAAEQEESIRVIHRALDLGVSVFDTADVYGPYSNERMLGRGLKGRRSRAVIATKVGLVAQPDGKLSRNGHPRHIRAACENSLSRLQTDVIDLYQLHRVDPDVPLEETWGAMAELVHEGKVRGLGISHASVEELERVHALFPISAVQYELSIWAPHSREVLQWCERTRTPFLAFSPLGRGFLAGQVDPSKLDSRDPRTRDPRFSRQAYEANKAIVEGIARVAARLNATPAQVSIAWVLAQSDLVVPIPATKRLRWLEQNVAAADLKLSEEDLRELSELPEAVGRMRWDYARSGR